MVEQRIEAITRVFKDEWDVIVFQEVWHRRERNQLIQCGVQAGYRAYHYFKAAVGFPLPLGHNAFSTGLLVLARHPIVDAAYYRYTLSGRVYALHEVRWPSIPLSSLIFVIVGLFGSQGCWVGTSVDTRG